MGRPACAALPQALNAGNAVLSLGCCGARAYLDALDDRVSMWALPGLKIERYCAEISALARANRFSRAFISAVAKTSKRANIRLLGNRSNGFQPELINPHERD